MRKLVLVLNILGFLNACVGQILQDGQCDADISLATNFDIEQFLGVWYEHARGANPVQGGDCSYMEFARNGTTYSYYNKALNNNFAEELSGSISIDGPKLSLNLNSDTGVATPLDLWILAVDPQYDTYALAYRCENVSPTQRQIYIWQLGRAPGPPTSLVNALVSTTLNNLFGITTNDLVTVDNSERACYELPVIGSNEAVILPGQCDTTLTGVPEFNATAFTGLWHEIASYYSENSLGSCPRAEYSLEGSGVKVVNSEVISQALRTIEGTATVISNDGSGRLLVNLEILPGVFAEQELYVLATDYVNYAITYTCVNVDSNNKRVNSWIASRSRQLSTEVQEAVDNVISEYLDLNQAYFQEAARTDADCFYYPEPQAGRVVRFRGQCDLNIPVVQNFDVARYLGLWHDIESYPSDSQGGTCNNAFYSLRPDADPPVVDVFNTMVVNQALDTINGEARVASDDGSAKLSVTFPDTVPFAMSYWVLDTDYDSYALVYTCTQIDEDTRNVWAWKLSRTKSLSTVAETNINAIISTIDVLDQRYFESKDQTPEGCFYFPEPVSGQPVVFPGTCNTNISVVENFNFSSFQGTWFEIEAYPKDDQPSQQCINHVWTQTTPSSFILGSFSVVNQFQQVTSSSASSSDSSGRFTITITNQNVQIPFWILATDYTDYALAYSCVDLADRPDFRAVYSWKLSRTKSLSQAAITAIDNIIADIEVLGNEYYETIGQTDDDCFFLPVLEAGEPVIIPGQCDPNIEVVTNFNAAAYLGTWHNIETYPSAFQLGTCSDATYSLQDDGSVLVFNTEVVNQQLSTITGRATVIASDDGSAKLSVTFPDAPAPIEYWVLATDYTSYSFVYSCVNINAEQRQVWSWKLSRTRNLTAEANAAINQVMGRVNVLNSQYYEVVDNTPEACFYYPEPTGGPVSFRGQCDENITVVQNFDVARYLGLWHDIESYPSEFQDGTCNNAFYSLRPDSDPPVVDVFNTMVINQTLDTINGEARLATDDGSAKLLVTFPDVPFPTNYWVLDTDYDTYAFVYTCMQTGEDTRSVWSWKLSRTKSLSTAAVTNINAIMSTIDVLDQRYFESTDQTAEGCFYFPEPVVGQPVVFPGTCDTNVSVVENFNFNLFQGTWHEIAAYPKDDQPSQQCINHVWSPSSTNSFTLQSSSVVNQFLQITNSTASSSNNSARLTITLTDQNVQIPFWILATDYTDYALAYSCVDLADRPDFRAVYSWKLSRSKSLSQAASNTIDSVIGNIEVLGNEYYETIGQTDDDCFYLPELEAGEPIILPGQCDPNITVVTNFDAAAYLGTWHMIETYPSAFQLGDCGDATYSLQDDGSVLVFNTEVVDQQLSTITGRATVIASDDGSAKLSVTFPDAPAPIEYWVLATDYTSYSLVYSCVNINSEQRQVFSWKLSRTRTLTAEANVAINEVISRVNVLNSQYYQLVDNSDEACFYFPEPDGSSVMFRGQCDETIPVVQNFDAVRYMGQWYDIEAYPSAFQEGSCNTAFYTLILEPLSVDVFNTQVINQTLDTINGVATLATDDGSAKLIVAFPSVDNPQPASNYWVLDTDYDTYALVYTCANIGPDSRLVFSWKLSRTRELTTTAQNNINAVISNISVIDQRYYQVKDHTDAGCFYFPEPRQGEPVVFPGTCDANITVVENLDLSQFAGTWYEIETYPKDFAPGQCISHNYTTGTANTLNLQTSSVTNQALQISQSTVTAPSAGSARLTITIANGVTIPFWIIATDYTDYALAYSCVDLANQPGYRGVYSWKLSKSKSLSSAAITNISNAMEAIDVIDERYFETVDQSDAGCFYYPELTANEPVIFVGECNASINAMSNFNAQRFAGRWFDIESYFDDDYEGECVDGRFSLTNATTFEIGFSQVINQNLISTTSSASIAADGSGRLTVTSASGTFEFLVLATDYDNYALIYSCNNVDANSRRVRSWKMSKTRELSTSNRTAIAAVTATIDVLDDRYYNVRDHSNTACFYFPTPVPGQQVRFRGECNDIPVVANFDVARYLGTWYDIESYPNEFQGGTCGIAQYSLSETEAGVVDVYNTQVINQRLDTINGTAVVASTDGSAKLTVTFPIVGTNFTIQTPYWVLTSDYDNYALVYSCNRVDDEYYSIGAWKLSRQQSLTSVAETAINNVMATVPELRQEYFEETGHTEDDCFFYPEQSGVIILSGTCPDSESVAAVTNFNASAFAGTWHEVARFPSNFLQVECASSELELDGINFSWTQNGVRDQELYVARTTATAVTAGRGVYAATIGTGSNAVPLELYILDTDYNEFALVYSCRSVGEDRKQIYSWKLSRSKSGLSEAATSRIDAIVSTERDLFEDYYEQADQSTDACFYYPRFETPPPVITMPGPCPNVSAVPGFDAARYLGRWFEIARYPQGDQNGTCSQAEYRLGTNQVDVRNTEVVNRVLDVQLGSAVVKSTDGSGILEVTFDVNGVTMIADYYILATDYDSYALVYNCQDLDDGQMAVFSWKLSRERELSDEANNVINAKIEEVRGLLEEFYIPTSQTEEDCFYVPELDPNSSPVFRGSCAEIETVSDFTPSAFLGWWHDTRIYALDVPIGECINSRYQQSGNDLFVVDTHVTGLEATVVNSTVTLLTNPARIIRTLSIGIQVEQFILETDYTSYALLYSCDNIVNEFGDPYRRVRSAVLSRTQVEPASENIANRIEATDVLENSLFLDVDQSDEACFYYPDSLQEGRVVLRGQCNDAIDVEPDFDLDAFTGIWYQMERYPYPELSDQSTCIGTNYMIANDTTNELRVINWEVNADGDLNEIEGTANLASDGSARFIVTLPSESGSESTATLHILKTDYTSYAVAFTCENLNDFERAVVAIKLSRTRSLPDAANAAINLLIEEREELHQPLFISVDHDDECEEPSSGYFVRSSIIVLLICAVWQLLM